MEKEIEDSDSQTPKQSKEGSLPEIFLTAHWQAKMLLNNPAVSLIFIKKLILSKKEEFKVALHSLKMFCQSRDNSLKVLFGILLKTGIIITYKNPSLKH